GLHFLGMATVRTARGNNSDVRDKRRISGLAAARRLAAFAGSLWFILLVATGLRLAYGREQVRQPNPQMLTVHFQQETGNIAYALATGRGFSSPQGSETGPTAWLTPIYPLLIAGIFRAFGIGTLHAFYASVLMNMIFSAGTCIPIFYVGKRLAGLGLAV